MTTAGAITTDERARATERTLKLFANEPAYRVPLRKLLVFCQAPHTTAEVEEAAAAFPEMKQAMHNPRQLLDWLARAGAIAQEIPREGDPTWQTTDGGQAAADSLSPDKKLRDLIAREPDCADIYQRLLAFCTTPRSRADIEAHLQDDPRVGVFTVLPSYFVQNLEAAGGLEWVGAWQTTEAGKGGAV